MIWAQSTIFSSWIEYNRNYNKKCSSEKSRIFLIHWSWIFTLLAIQINSSNLLSLHFSPLKWVQIRIGREKRQNIDVIQITLTVTWLDFTLLLINITIIFTRSSIQTFSFTCLFARSTFFITWWPEWPCIKFTA